MKIFVRTDHEEAGEQRVFLMQARYEETCLLFLSLATSILAMCRQPVTDQVKKVLERQRSLLGYWLAIAWDIQEPELVFDLSVPVSGQIELILQAFDACSQAIGEYEEPATSWKEMCDKLKKQTDGMLSTDY